MSVFLHVYISVVLGGHRAAKESSPIFKACHLEYSRLEIFTFQAARMETEHSTEFSVLNLQCGTHHICPRSFD